MRASGVGEGFFEDVRVPADCLLGQEGDALRTVLTDPAFAERLRARQRAVQDVRIAGLKEAAL